MTSLNNPLVEELFEKYFSDTETFKTWVVEISFGYYEIKKFHTLSSG